MPRYKKKKHNRIFNAPKKRVKQPVRQKRDDDIKMTPSKPVKKAVSEKTEIKVVKGKKGENLRKASAAAFVAAIAAIVLVILQLLLPAGIIQTLSNATALIGTGSYPITVSGNQTLSVVPLNNYYFHLTDSHFAAYSNGGKILFSDAHGYEKAILCTSKGKALVYNQGDTHFSVYDLKGKKTEFKTENEIICCAISDSGNFAVVTYSDSYASAVIVYNKRGKVIYEWYSAEDLINNIVISSNGKKIAVSTFNSSGGVLNSKVNIIDFKSATPLNSENFENEIIYGLKNGNKSNFLIIKSNGIDTVNWSSFKKQEYTDEYDISYYRSNTSLNVAVFCRESDKTDNKIIVFSKNGKVKNNIRYKGVINDIQVKGSNIYCINDSSVVVLDFDGNVKFNVNYGFGGTGISVLSANVVAVITDNDITRIKLS